MILTNILLIAILFVAIQLIYEDLQILWETYKNKGLIVIGVPSKSFNQEKITIAGNPAKIIKVRNE